MPLPYLRPCSLDLFTSLSSDPGNLCILLRLCLIPRPLPLCYLGIVPHPILIRDPGDLSFLFCLGLGPRPLPLHGLGISLRLGLYSLPCPFCFFPDIGLCPGPCLSLRPLSLRFIGLFPGPNPISGLLCLPLCGVGPLPRPHLGLNIGPLARLGGDPGNLCLCSHLGLGPHPYPLQRIGLYLRLFLSCLPCPLGLFPRLVLNPGPCL